MKIGSVDKGLVSGRPAHFPVRADVLFHREAEPVIELLGFRVPVFDVE